MSGAARDAVVHVVLLLLVPPLLPGLIAKTKAFVAGRRGPPVLQLYFDLWKLARKGLVISRTTTWIFRAAPVVGLFAVLLAGLLVPLGSMDAPLGFVGDFILLVSLLGLARFFTAAAALDTGSAFEGMGASRDVTFACLCEPAVLFALLVLARLSGALDLAGMLGAPRSVPWTDSAAPLVLTASGLFIVLLAETCRIPVDDPNTHLELTMIHEVMVLDHSGPLLGLVLYGAAVKLFVLGAVLLHVLLPFGTGGTWTDLALFLGEMAGLAVVVGAVESGMARLQIRHVPFLLTAAIFLCGFGFLLLVR